MTQSVAIFDIYQAFTIVLRNNHFEICGQNFIEFAWDGRFFLTQLYVWLVANTPVAPLLNPFSMLYFFSTKN